MHSRLSMTVWLHINGKYSFTTIWRIHSLAPSLAAGNTVWAESNHQNRVKYKIKNVFKTNLQKNTHTSCWHLLHHNLKVCLTIHTLIFTPPCACVNVGLFIRHIVRSLCSRRRFFVRLFAVFVYGFIWRANGRLSGTIEGSRLTG